MRSSLPVAAVLAVLAVPPAAAAAGDDPSSLNRATTTPTGFGTKPAGTASPLSAGTSPRTASATTGASTATDAAAPTSDAAAPAGPDPAAAAPAPTAPAPAPAPSPAPAPAATAPVPAAPAPATPAPAAPADPGPAAPPEDADGPDETLAHPEDESVRADARRAERRRDADRRQKRSRAREERAEREARTDDADSADPDDEAAKRDADARTSTRDRLAAAPDQRVSKASLRNFRIPLFLLPIYQAAGTQYGVRWEVLAAINEIETDYGRNLNVSTAGARGWMQFMPATWKSYGVDATGDGKADPYNPADAIFASARYLKAAGAEDDIERAIFAYNHADWYVDDVMERAESIAKLPTDVVGSLTGLSTARPPVAAEDAEVRASGPRTAAPVAAPEGSRVAAVQDGTVTATGESDERGRWIELKDAYGNRYTYTHLGDLADRHLVARDEDGGRHDDGGKHGDGHGDAGDRGASDDDGGVAADPGAANGDAARAADGGGGGTDAANDGGAPRTTATPGDGARTGGGRGEDDLTVAGGGTATTKDPAPTRAATAGRQRARDDEDDRRRDDADRPAGAATTSTAAAPTSAPAAPTSAPGAPTSAVPTSAAPTSARPTVASPTTVPPTTGSALDGGWMWSADSLRRALGTTAPAPTPAPVAAPDDRPRGELERFQVRSAGLQRSELRLTALHEGSRVTAGTVLGTTGSTSMRFAVRPAGRDAPRIDPRPIVDGWERLEETATGDDAHRPASARLATAGDASAAADADAGSLLLLRKDQLQRRVLSNPRIELYPGGADDVRTGQIDRRVLATLEYLTADGTKIAVSSLRGNHGRLTAGGNVSAHSYGSAVDISTVDGTPIAGHQGAGSITETTVRRLLRLQGAAAPNQIISLMTIDGAPTTIAMDDHADHIHVGFPRVGADEDGRLGDQVAATLKPTQWPDLVERLDAIDNPDVRTTVSKAATEAGPRDPLP